MTLELDWLARRALAVAFLKQAMEEWRANGVKGTILAEFEGSSDDGVLKVALSPHTRASLRVMGYDFRHAVDGPDAYSGEVVDGSVLRMSLDLRLAKRTLLDCLSYLLPPGLEINDGGAAQITLQVETGTIRVLGEKFYLKNPDDIAYRSHEWEVEF
ncbi:MAG: hypothetical protein WCK33_06515 [Phycisphaerae bacterium]